MKGRIKNRLFIRIWLTFCRQGLLEIFQAESAFKKNEQGPVDELVDFRQGTGGCRKFFEQGLLKKIPAGSARIPLIFMRNRETQNKGLVGRLETMDEGTMVIAAAIIVFVGSVTSVWLLWLVAFAFLFQIQQSVARAERRLENLEKPDPIPPQKEAGKE